MRLKNFSLLYGAQVFKAFSDTSRVRILHLLFYAKSLCISDLEHILGFTQTKTSRHMIYLKNAGLVSSQKVDQRVFYFIKDELIDIVGIIFSFLNKDSYLIADHEIYEVLLSNRELATNKLEITGFSEG